MTDDKIISSNGFKYLRMPSGKLFSFYDAIHAADLAESAFSRAISRAFKLIPDWPGEPEYKANDFERIEWALDDMESYIKSAREYLDKQRGYMTKKERIALLRNTTGRSPEEAAAFLAKADELERRLEAGDD